MLDGLDLSKLNLNNMMGQMKDIVDKAKEEHSNKTFTSQVGAGLIKITINGNCEVTDLQIDDTLLSDKNMLQVLLISSMNDVLKQVEENGKNSSINFMKNLNPLEQKS